MVGDQERLELSQVSRAVLVVSPVVAVVVVATVMLRQFQVPVAQAAMVQSS